MREVKVKLDHWEKGMRITCPECLKKIAPPYICKCGIELKPYVKMKFK